MKPLTRQKITKFFVSRLNTQFEVPCLRHICLENKFFCYRFKKSLELGQLSVPLSHVDLEIKLLPGD